MEWFLILFGIGVATLAVYIILTSKRQGRDSVPGRFDFERYKAEELSRRGLFDQTKWR